MASIGESFGTSSAYAYSADILNLDCPLPGLPIYLGDDCEPVEREYTRIRVAGPLGNATAQSTLYRLLNASIVGPLGTATARATITGVPISETAYVTIRGPLGDAQTVIDAHPIVYPGDPDYGSYPTYDGYWTGPAITDPLYPARPDGQSYYVTDPVPSCCINGWKHHSSLPVCGEDAYDVYVQGGVFPYYDPNIGWTGNTFEETGWYWFTMSGNGQYVATQAYCYASDNQFNPSEQDYALIRIWERSGNKWIFLQEIRDYGFFDDTAFVKLSYDGNTILCGFSVSAGSVPDGVDHWAILYYRRNVNGIWEFSESVPLDYIDSDGNPALARPNHWYMAASADCEVFVELEGGKYLGSGLGFETIAIVYDRGTRHVLKWIDEYDDMECCGISGDGNKIYFQSYNGPGDSTLWHLTNPSWKDDYVSCGQIVQFERSSGTWVQTDRMYVDYETDMKPRGWHERFFYSWDNSNVLANYDGSVVVQIVNRSNIPFKEYYNETTDYYDMHYVQAQGISFVYHKNGSTWDKKLITNTECDPIGSWYYAHLGSTVMGYSAQITPDGKKIVFGSQDMEGGPLYEYNEETLEWELKTFFGPHYCPNDKRFLDMIPAEQTGLAEDMVFSYLDSGYGFNQAMQISNDGKFIGVMSKEWITPWYFVYMPMWWFFETCD